MTPDDLARERLAYARACGVPNTAARHVTMSQFNEALDGWYRALAALSSLLDAQRVTVHVRCPECGKREEARG